MTDLLRNGPAKSPTLILAHGSGAPMDTPFMTTITEMIAEHDIEVVRFEFSYMASRRTGGSKRPPSQMPKLIEEFGEVIASCSTGQPVFIGGKSLGGRVASMITAQPETSAKLAGLVCLGYPFHPPGRPDSLRTQHFNDITCPGLVMQGERDPFGTSEDVAAYDLPKNLQVQWAPFGNHDLVPPKRSGLTAEDNWKLAADTVAGFIKANI